MLTVIIYRKKQIRNLIHFISQYETDRIFEIDIKFSKIYKKKYCDLCKKNKTTEEII